MLKYHFFSLIRPFCAVRVFLHLVIIPERAAVNANARTHWLRRILTYYRRAGLTQPHVINIHQRAACPALHLFHEDARARLPVSIGYLTSPSLFLQLPYRCDTNPQCSFTRDCTRRRVNCWICCNARTRAAAPRSESPKKLRIQTKNFIGRSYARMLQSAWSTLRDKVKMKRTIGKMNPFFI